MCEECLDGLVLAISENVRTFLDGKTMTITNASDGKTKKRFNRPELDAQIEFVLDNCAKEILKGTEE